MSKKIQYNKYEQAFLVNYEIIKYSCLGLSAFNLFLPVFKPLSMGITNLFQWLLIVFVYFYSYKQGTGKWKGQKVPIIQLVVIRSLEFLAHTFLPFLSKLNYVVFGILVFLDILLMIFLIMDKGSSGYEYERDEEESDSDGIE